MCIALPERTTHAAISCRQRGFLSRVVVAGESEARKPVDTRKVFGEEVIEGRLVAIPQPACKIQVD